MKTPALLILALSFATYARDDASCSHYNRKEQFGTWEKVEGCIDTRSFILRARSSEPVTGKCAVKTGSWVDPYTDSTFTDAHNLQIDHVVPLKEAYQSGAYLWTDEQRRAYANDTFILVAASVHQNESKGDKDVSNWLPPKHKKEYCIKWAAIKRKYDLTSDSLEIVTLKSFGVPEKDLPKQASEIDCVGE